MPRPDRAHYVIDVMPDTMRITNTATGEIRELESLQVWIDPAFPEAQNDPQLRAYMFRMAQDHGMPTMLRWSNRDATAVFPPPLNDDGVWHEIRQECNEGVGRFSSLPKQWQDSLRKSR